MTYNQTIQQIHDECERQVDYCRLMIHMHAHEYSALSAFIDSLGRPSGWCEEGQTYYAIGFRPGSLNGLIVQMNLMKDESFKAVEPIATFFIQRGWQPSGNDDDAAYGCRGFYFKKRVTDVPLFWPSHKEWPGTYELTATIRVWPHKESLHCKKVEAGTETKYKWQCGEQVGA